MPRQRKPIELQKGDLTIERKKALENQAQALSKCHNLDETPPEWLSADAVRVWKELIPNLRPLTSIGNLDRDVIGGFCNAAAQYRQATKMLEQDGLIVEGKENPMFKVQTTCAKEMREFAGKCGLTIDSRLKIAETYLKEVDENITDDFGDI